MADKTYNNNILGTGYLYLGTASIDASAISQIDSVTKGILTPRMTGAEMLAIASPATGLVVYNTTENLFYFYNGLSWLPLDTNTPAGANTEVQYNDNGDFGASPNLTYNSATNTLTVTGQTTTTSLTVSDYTLPTNDGNPADGLFTDGLGNIYFAPSLAGTKYTESITGLTGSVSQATHLRGTHPIVQVTELGDIVDVQVSIDHYTGDVVWASDVALTAGEIVIL